MTGLARAVAAKVKNVMSSGSKAKIFVAQLAKALPLATSGTSGTWAASAASAAAWPFADFADLLDLFDLFASFEAKPLPSALGFLEKNGKASTFTNWNAQT